MSEQATFLDSFDHAGTAYAAVKYRAQVGTYTEVTGPYHGVGGRFGGIGNELRTPASFVWNSGHLSASVKVDASGWTGSGEAALLAPGSFTTAGGGADFAHHWLTVDSSGTLRVRRWVAPPFAPPSTTVLATSASGALPLDAWCRLEYRTQLRTDSTNAGVVGCRVNGTDVLAATGLVTCDPQRAVADGNTWRLGHLQEDASGTDGVGGLGSGGGAVGVAFDDVCLRADSTLGAALLAHRDDSSLPHRVRCLFPTGAGASAGLTVTGAGANWAACAEAPPDGDTSYVDKPSGSAPTDRYAITAPPEIVEGSAAGAVLRVWGLGKSADAVPRIVVALTDGDGSPEGNNALAAAGYVYRALGYPPGGGVTTLTNALLAGLEIGWGLTGSSTTASYRGTQVVAELWYRPGAAPAARTWVAWVGT